MEETPINQQECDVFYNHFGLLGDLYVWIFKKPSIFIHIYIYIKTKKAKWLAITSTITRTIPKITSINITSMKTPAWKAGGVFVGCMAASTVSTIIEARQLYNHPGGSVVIVLALLIYKLGHWHPQKQSYISYIYTTIIESYHPCIHVQCTPSSDYKQRPWESYYELLKELVRFTKIIAKRLVSLQHGWESVCIFYTNPLRVQTGRSQTEDARIVSEDACDSCTTPPSS